MTISHYKAVILAVITAREKLDSVYGALDIRSYIQR